MADSNSFPIAKEFYNSETNQPFTTCMMCNNPLAETQYVVEKAFRNFKSLGTQEIIFEYASCLSCVTKMHFELSEESRTRVQDYLVNNIKTNSFNSSDIKDSLNRCAVKQTALHETQEYSIYGLCNGNEMVVGNFPYALSGEAQDEIMQLLSAKSLELLDDFIGNHFTGPPEVMEILRRRPVFI